MRIAIERVLSTRSVSVRLSRVMEGFSRPRFYSAVPLPDTLYSTNTDSNDISVIDLSTRREVTRISVGGSPRGSVRIAPDGRLGYVSNTAGNSISVLDLVANKEVGRIPVGLAPRGLVLSITGKIGFVSNSGSDYLSIIDLEAGKEIRKIEVGANPRHLGMTPDGKKIIASLWGDDKVAIVESPIFAHKDAVSLLTAQTRMRVLDAEEYRKKRLLEDAVDLTKVSVGDLARPYSVAVDKAGKTLYVANTQADYVSEIDLETATLVRKMPVGYGGRAILVSPDSPELYVSVENTNEVAVLDTSTGTVKRRMDTGPSPRGLAYYPPRDEIYASIFTRTMTERPPMMRNSLTVLERKTGKLVDEVAVGLGPCSASVRMKK